MDILHKVVELDFAYLETFTKRVETIGNLLFLRHISISLLVEEQ